MAACIIAGVSLLLMTGWFWSMMTAKGFILSAEQQNAPAAQAAKDAEEEAAAESDQTQADRDRQAESDSVPGESIGDTKGDGPPQAPDESQTSTDQWELEDWSILSVNGVLNVSGQVINTSSESLSGTLKAFVYVDGVLVATAKTEVVDFAAGAKDKVNLVSESDWEAGEKVLFLEFTPRK